MKRSTRWMIFTIYYMSQALGLAPFAYKCDTGKLETNVLITFYSCIVNILMFSTLPLVVHMQWKPRKLHLKITALLSLIHLLAALAGIVINWAKRKHILSTVRDFQHLRANVLKKRNMSERVAEYYEGRIRSKFVWGLLSTILRFMVSYDSVRYIFDMKSKITIIGLCVLSNVLDVIMAHYFFALLNVNALLAVINEDIERALSTSSMLFKLQCLKRIKAGTLTTACCKLADELEDLAMEHYNLKQLGERINRMYQLQAACVVLTLYLNNIAVIFMMYAMIQHKDFSQLYSEMVVMLVIPLLLFFFYKDLHTFLLNMLSFGDFVERAASLLNSYQSWLPTLDERLEKSLKDFSMQLAIYPFQMKLLGLFHFNRPMAFATFGSTISNAVILIQFDYKYSKY